MAESGGATPCASPPYPTNLVAPASRIRPRPPRRRGKRKKAKGNSSGGESFTFLLLPFTFDSAPGEIKHGERTALPTGGLVCAAQMDHCSWPAGSTAEHDRVYPGPCLDDADRERHRRAALADRFLVSWAGASRARAACGAGLSDQRDAAHGAGGVYRGAERAPARCDGALGVCDDGRVFLAAAPRVS